MLRGNVSQTMPVTTINTQKQNRFVLRHETLEPPPARRLRPLEQEHHPSLHHQCWNVTADE